MDPSYSRKRSRSRSRSPPPWRQTKGPRHDFSHPNSSKGSGMPDRRKQESFVREQTRRNLAQEAEQMKEWVSKEDDFVLKQSKKKARIRVREGRAKPIDWLAVILGVIDPTTDLLDEDSPDSELDVMDPEGVIEELSLDDLRDTEKDIENYLTLEKNKANRLYWNSMKVICKDRRRRVQPDGRSSRVVRSVSADVDKLLGPKDLEQLIVLEGQVKKKLESNEPIDVEYWEQLLDNIGVFKARAQLKAIYKSVIDSRLQTLKDQQVSEALVVQEKLAALYHDPKAILPSISYSKSFDPEPLLKVKTDDKGLEVVPESEFLEKIASDRQRIQKMRYVPLRQRKQDKPSASAIQKIQEASSAAPGARFASLPSEDFSQATKALYEREVARGVQEDEEIFTGEEEVSTLSKSQWASKYRPRKPRYFNRVQMGYEWNKYNQTHYDHDNPPPKVVQGYKFNIFYPDLIDKAKAPTYRIERENGRKRGQSFAPAGEEDTCLIRFISGPPYEDLAFRIVDKEWDYSAKRERGFRSSFDKGILQLHFQFKKVYYRK